MRITTKTLVEVLVVVVRSALCVLPFISTVVVATNSGVVPRTSGIFFNHNYFEELFAGVIGMISMGLGAYGYGVYDYYTARRCSKASGDYIFLFSVSLLAAGFSKFTTSFMFLCSLCCEC
eukprot:GHVQ01009353.1.p1 GENE.GHVQ01009353.1~~GHVQ01009353.1.p1  ORF type:complete len:120 (-),score=0.63 GHVQ01009353.1:560-919(-)